MNFIADSEKVVPPYSWQAFYVLSKNWQSDLTFFGDEIKFFKKLVNKYFIWLHQDENIAITEDLITRMINMERDRLELVKNINKHLSQITDLINDEHDKQEEINQFLLEHQDLEIDTAVFTKRFRDLKKEVFKVTEEILESERLSHLLQP